MEMVCHLDSDVFDVVKNGTKNVEVRLLDEKRKKLQVGDTIKFLRRPLEVDNIEAKVIGLDYYENFTELVENYEMKRLYLESTSKEEFLQLLERFYSKEEQEENGVVAILFEIE